MLIMLVTQKCIGFYHGDIVYLQVLTQYNSGESIIPSQLT